MKNNIPYRMETGNKIISNQCIFLLLLCDLMLKWTINLNKWHIDLDADFNISRR